METAIPLGRVAGIRIGMSWVVPLVAAAYSLLLAERVLPVAVPGRAPSAYWIAALAGAAGYFGSILVHEVGHALVGRRERMGVRGITLSLLGGNTEFTAEPPTAGAEIRVSAVGPLSNLVLAAVFQLASTTVGTDLYGDPGLAGHLFGGLALLNLLLAVANLVPAPPLDGASVLSGLLWLATRDRRRADLTAAGVGLVIGVGLTVGGGLLLFGQSVDPITAVLIVGYGVFIVAAARRQMATAPTLARLRAVPIGAVMTPDPPVVPEWSTLSDVVAWSATVPGHRAFAVQAADGRITGVVTAAVVRAVDPARWPALRAAEVAWPIDRVVVAGADESVLSVTQRSSGTHGAPILVLAADGRLVGAAGADVLDRALTVRGEGPPGYVPPP